MKLVTFELTITRPGYVKDEDELVLHLEDSRMIVENALRQLEDELDQAGYGLTVKEDQ